MKNNETIFIDKSISSKVVTVSVNMTAKGGMASVILVLSKFYEKFNFLASTSSQSNMFIKLGILLKCFPRLFHLIIIKRVKIVHIHTASYGSFFRKMTMLLFCKLLGAKTILHIHGAQFKLFYEKYNKFGIVKILLRKPDVLIVLSKTWKDFFLNDVGIKQVQILNNIVNKAEFSERLNIPLEPRIKFLFLGEVGQRKGIYDLLDVVIKHKEIFKDEIEIHIGGNGEVDRLNDIIETNQLVDIVFFEGWVDTEKKFFLLSDCNVFILPSYNEGLPISILEAMSYNMPIISTTVGGIPEILENGLNGFLIEPGDKDAMLKAIMYFIENRGAIEQMGDENEAIVQNYYPEAVIPQLTAIYTKLLEK